MFKGLFWYCLQARDEYYSGTPLILDDMFDKIEVRHWLVTILENLLNHFEPLKTSMCMSKCMYIYLYVCVYVCIHVFVHFFMYIGIEVVNMFIVKKIDSSYFIQNNSLFIYLFFTHVTNSVER